MRNCPWWKIAAFAAAFFGSSAAAARAQHTEPAPKELQDIGVTENPNVQIPLELPFVDSDGKPVRLGDFFDGQTPVILTMNYSDCPMLCSLQLNGLFAGLQGVDWDLGRQYRMVTVSIDPDEKPDRADATKMKYLEIYDRPGVAQGWHFLTGAEADIRRLARTVGFGYAYLPDTREYAHAAVTMVCTPDGRLSRYLYGIEYPPQTLRLALLEASEGKIGTTIDRVMLFCFQYDETAGRYGPAAMKIMQAGGVLTIVFLAGMLGIYWLREARKARRQKVVHQT
ncbi:MAG: SCO family protein [Thermoguttaceae bacterium]